MSYKIGQPVWTFTRDMPSRFNLTVPDGWYAATILSNGELHGKAFGWKLVCPALGPCPPPYTGRDWWADEQHLRPRDPDDPVLDMRHNEKTQFDPKLWQPKTVKVRSNDPVHP